MQQPRTLIFESNAFTVKGTFYRRNKELLLKLSSISLVILFFVLIEVVVRILFPAKAIDHMIDLGPINLFSKREIDGQVWYGITNKNAYSDRNVLFKEKKDPDHIRIICLGGSASAGWPHPPEEIYSRYLEKVLQKQYPNKKVEVINCSAHGFASYRIRQVFETIIPFKPDAVIIWSGNNEFLEGRSYRTSEFKNTLIRFRNNFRSLQLVRQMFVDHRYDDTPDVAETFWRKVNEQALELRSDADQFAKVKEHYEESISGILEEALENKIKVFLMTVPVNLRDWEPNVSWLGITGQDSVSWRTAFEEGSNHLTAGRFDDAVLAFERAHQMAPRHAETMFRLAKSLDASDDTLQALKYYVKARDFDYNPFRAISDFNNTLRRLAMDHPEVLFLDMEQRMNVYAEKGIPGFDLFLDYVHPTKDGNLAITREVANAMIGANLFGLNQSSVPWTLEAVWQSNATPYRDEDDMFVQFTRFSLCCMTHQYRAALHFGKTLREKFPPESFDNDPTGRMRILKDALNAFEPYAAWERSKAAGTASAEEEAKVMSGIRDFYKKHFPYGAF